SFGYHPVRHSQTDGAPQRQSKCWSSLDRPPAGHEIQNISINNAMASGDEQRIDGRVFERRRAAFSSTPTPLVSAERTSRHLGCSAVLVSGKSVLLFRWGRIATVTNINMSRLRRAGLQCSCF